MPVGVPAGYAPAGQQRGPTCKQKVQRNLFSLFDFLVSSQMWLGFKMGALIGGASGVLFSGFAGWRCALLAFCFLTNCISVQRRSARSATAAYDRQDDRDECRIIRSIHDGRPGHQVLAHYSNSSTR